jgi:polar amino acid transport system permease protein
MRGTPLMLQLIIIYYGPGIFIKHNIWGSGDGGRFMASLIAFVINYACYFAAIYRGGMESIPKGQYEAGYVMHMNKVQIFVYIIFLQMVKHILPAISNEVISLVKDTSLARVVAVYEIIWSGQSFIKSSGIIWPLLYTGIFYLDFNGILTLLFKKAEEKLAYIQ